MLRRSLEELDGAEVRTFTWGRAIGGRFDVFHVHWPEILVYGHGRWKTLAREILTAVFLAKLRMARTPIVRTVHNVKLPEPMSRIQRLLLREIDRQTVLRVHLNETTPAVGDSVLIRHGHYREWFARFPRSATTIGRISYFGLVRRYKRVDRLLDAFADAPASWTLHIAGKPSDLRLVEELRGRAAQDPRITHRLEYVDDRTLVEVVTASELVVLPYDEMHNSGSVLAALSLDRPVLVPANATTDLLAREVGPGWVHRFSGQLTTADLTRTVEQLRTNPPPAPPDLSAREWSDVGRRHVEAYRRAIANRRRTPGR